MSKQEPTRERTVPVALRFNASPELQRTLDGLLLPKQRHLAGEALRFYITGDEELPVIFSDLDGVDDTGSAGRVLERYNHTLAKSTRGEVPYFHHFPVTQINHYASDDNQYIDFAVHIGTTTREMNYLKQAPFDQRIDDELLLLCRRPLLQMQPLSERVGGYRQLRQALGRGSLYVTRPTAVTVPRHVDQYSQE
jgi:hypothetical protein